MRGKVGIALELNLAHPILALQRERRPFIPTAPPEPLPEPLAAVEPGFTARSSSVIIVEPELPVNEEEALLLLL